ncbi:MAG: low molecular weight phosphotyrosine protein phosphatase, partial [Ignavibacteriaceae bacterium]|nr:low molecular weight phosphotyrosine protein phosphatase [Ignavibacteriaceae bacterium]
MKKKILFVCMGNICRSPAAEGIAKKLIEEKALNGTIEIDSAGTLDYHTGKLPDERMIKHASKRGYILDSLARQFNPKKDFECFDYIVTMDDDNYSEITSLDKENRDKSKIFKMVSFSKKQIVNEVPDPYYTGSDGFEFVLDILEDSVEGLLNKV